MTVGDEMNTGKVSMDPEGAPKPKRPKILSWGTGLVDKRPSKKKLMNSPGFDESLEEELPAYRPMSTVEVPEGVPYKPLWLCRLICRRPYAYFGVCMLFHLAIIGTTIALYLTNYPIFPSNFDNLPLDVRDSDLYLEQTAWLHRADSKDLYNRDASLLKISAERRTRYDRLTTFFLYRSREKSENILNKYYLDRLKEIENEIYEDKEYQEEFCFLNHYDQCWKPHSVLRLFDGSYAMMNPIFHDPNFTNINAVIMSALQIPQLASYLPLLGKDFSYANASEVFANSLLTMHSYGLPLKGFTSTKDSDEKQKDKIEAYLVKTWYKKWNDYAENGYNNLQILTRNLALYFYALNEQILTDSLLMIGSFSFIFLFAWFQTESLWLSLLGILNTIFSFLAGNLVYNCVFDFKYLGGFHLVSIFIILGIAADNVFIFCDTWKSLARYNDVTVRLSYCYGLAAKSMLVTSLTTAAAFLLNSFSSILAMSSFGAYSGIVILINYLYVITFYPAVIVIWHNNFENRLSPCHKNKVDKHDATPDVIDCTQKMRVKCTITGDNHVIDVKETTTEKHDTKNRVTINEVVEIQEVKLQTTIKSHSKSSGYFTNSDESIDSEHVTTETVKMRKRMKSLKSKPRDRWLVRFFYTTYFKFLSKRIVQVFTLIFFLCLVTVMIYFMTTLESDDKKPRAMVASHPMELFDVVMEDRFDSRIYNPYGKLYIVWGLRKQNTSQCHRRKYDYCYGETEWDPNFDLNSPPAQKQMLDFCDRLSNLGKDDVAALKIRLDDVTGKPMVKCFMKDMDDFYRREGAAKFRDQTPKYPNNTAFSIPMSPTKTRMMMSHNPQLYNVSDLGDTFYRYFETSYAYWITGVHMPALRYPALAKFSDVIGEEAQKPDARPINGDPEAMYGTRLRYAAIEVQLLGVNPHHTFFKDGLRVYDRWVEFVKESVSKMVPPLRGAFQTTTFEWNWFHMQKVLSDQAILGMTLGITVAWVLLVLSCGNWIVGTMAIVTIATICVCVIGMIPMAGWKFGILEAMNITLVVGLSVDYVVHLGIAYNKSACEDRPGRVQRALHEYGISVLSGAITTLGSSFFMFFAQVAFFSQFGAFMFATIGFSILFALTFFIVVLLLLGPEGKTGSNDVIFTFIVHKCFSGYFKDKTDDDDEFTMKDDENVEMTAFDKKKEEAMITTSCESDSV